jgi:hypothetical protein
MLSGKRCSGRRLRGTLGVDGTAYNDLGLAICCYVMTGDSVAAGVLVELGRGGTVTRPASRSS